MLGAAVILASYLFVSILAWEDREGHRTLSSASALVTALRRVGDRANSVVDHILVAPMLPLLVVAAIVTLALLRRFRARAWRHDLACAVVAPSLVATALLVLIGQLAPAVATGALAGISSRELLRGPEPAWEREASSWLFLVPLGIGAVLRFYALAEVPNGYAEHAVVHHIDLSIPYLDALSSSLDAHRLQPFLGVASNALVHEQFGFPALVAATGFKLFGVTLTVTRLVSALLGTLTIYVAYRLGRALDGVSLGLVFSFLLAVSPWHVTISRYGDQEHVVAPLQFLLSLLFVVLAVHTGRIRDVVLAGLFTALGFYIYAPNLVVPAIVGSFLLCRAAAQPRRVAEHWPKVVLGVGSFAIFSYPALREYASSGLSVRTGYQGTSPLSDVPEHLRMIGPEANQLFRQAADPWFAMPGGGVGLLQSTLLVPGLVLAAAVLRQKRYSELALLALIGLPIAAVPAVLAPDVSFRRLMLVATLVALVSAFTLARLAEAARAEGVSRRALTIVVCGGAVALGAAGTYGYFDQTVVAEEINNASLRAVGDGVSNLLGNEPVVVVVPRMDDINDTNRFIELMSHAVLVSAQRRGVPRNSLYETTTCSDVGDRARFRSVGAPPPTLVLRDTVLEEAAPCGPKLASRLKSLFPRSAIVVAEPAAPSY